MNARGANVKYATSLSFKGARRKRGKYCSEESKLRKCEAQKEFRQRYPLDGKTSAWSHKKTWETIRAKR